MWLSEFVEGLIVAAAYAFLCSGQSWAWADKTVVAACDVLAETRGSINVPHQWLAAYA